MAKKKSDSKKYLVVLAVILIVAFLGYGVYSYISSGAKEQGVIVCNPQDPNECYWQAHIHTFVLQEVCGEQRQFSKEHGELEEHHTHEETNIIHWHDRVPIDRETGELKDTSSLTLGAFMTESGINFSDTCFYEYCNGDVCPSGSTGTVKMFVKSKNKGWEQNTEYSNYIWQDGDIIYIAFDSRTQQEASEYLTKQNVRFPLLGAG